MRTSSGIDQIAAALSAAQAEMTGAKKSSKNPFFKSNYADLASVMEAISEPFAAHGLSFIQSAGMSENGGVSVTTMLMHKSGQWIESDPMVVPPVKNDPQAFGSAVTYAKRYSLQALVGVPSVDDDGNAAVQGSQQQHAQARRQRQAEAAPAVDVDQCKMVLRVAVDEAGMEGLIDAWKKLTPAERTQMNEYKDALKKELEAAQ